MASRILSAVRRPCMALTVTSGLIALIDSLALLTFGCAYVGVAVDDLALKVGKLYNVAVGYTDSAHSGACEI